MNLRDNYKYTHISTATTTVVDANPCVLVSIIVNTTAAGTVTVYDNTSAASPIVAVLKASIAEGAYEYKIRLVTGCTIVTAAASDLTIVTAEPPF